MLVMSNFSIFRPVVSAVRCPSVTHLVTEIFEDMDTINSTDIKSYIDVVIVYKQNR